MMTGTDATASLTSTRPASAHPAPVRPAPAHPVELPERLRGFLSADPLSDVAGTGEQITIRLPFTADPLASFSGARGEDVTAAIARARRAQQAWAARSVRERAEVFLTLHDLVRRNEELLLDVVQAETGKARQHAYDEVLDSYNVSRFTALAAPRTLGASGRRGAVPGLTRTQVDHAPLGVIGFISPWNYPLSLGANDLIASLIAGNAVVHKPDSQTVLSAVLMRRLAIEAGLPRELWQLVPGDVAEVSDPLLGGVDGLSFTGSTAAGRSIAEAVAGRLIPVVLELGGKNAMIVCADADMDTAIDCALRGAFSSGGQLCLSIERIYVVGERYEEFVDRFVAAAEALVQGASFDYSHELGSLTSAQQVKKVHAHVEQARETGATVRCGGRLRTAAGPWMYAQTVLTDVTPEADLFAAETFGPVVSVYPAASDAEAIAAANSLSVGLNASVISASAAHGWQVAWQVEAGMVNINEAFAAVWGSIAAPSGGIKDSGLGHRHGTEALLAFTRTRSIARQSLLPLAPSRLLPAERFQQTMTTALAVMRALRMR
ncbi:succinic semialdehyde dehydrogenase [Brevibacterium otitidis]|uniref:Succinic semialdehyde dehydrogenase n=1 Tax=Brevibacterium otitidis TaxID=53364 RepID=A0ABV5X3J6_9MICO|nr:succinic semialdehyde dehydrogenase [Brevibacterium otitidis]